MMTTAYVNGHFVPLKEARVSPLDRGFLFGDGVYEVIPVYQGKLFHVEAHIERLKKSLAAVRIPNPLSFQEWCEMLCELVRYNGGGNQSVYFQVTRGVAPRMHHFPSQISPSVFAMTHKRTSNPLISPVAAITLQDYRWFRCDIKSIALIANAMLRQEAIEHGASEAILIRENQVTEGAASNVFVAKEGLITTPPTGPYLLAGVTRDLLITLLNKHGICVREEIISENALARADEIWLTSSSLEITPVETLNGTAVGKNVPGPMWKIASKLFNEHREAFIAGNSTDKKKKHSKKGRQLEKEYIES